MFRFEFFTDDRHVTDILRAIQGRARGLSITPVVNVHEESSNNGEPKSKSQNGAELFVEEMKKRGLNTVNARQARDITQAIGRSPMSYYHTLFMCMKYKLLKKTGTKQKSIYTLTEGA